MALNEDRIAIIQVAYSQLEIDLETVRRNVAAYIAEGEEDPDAAGNAMDILKFQEWLQEIERWGEEEGFDPNPTFKINPDFKEPNKDEE